MLRPAPACAPTDLIVINSKLVGDNARLVNEVIALKDHNHAHALSPPPPSPMPLMGTTSSMPRLRAAPQPDTIAAARTSEGERGGGGGGGGDEKKPIPKPTRQRMSNPQFDTIEDLSQLSQFMGELGDTSDEFEEEVRSSFSVVCPPPPDKTVSEEGRSSFSGVGWVCWGWPRGCCWIPHAQTDACWV
jgi:hypothetical protein